MGRSKGFLKEKASSEAWAELPEGKISIQGRMNEEKSTKGMLYVD